MEFPRYENTLYEQYKANVHSQNGEDGVVSEILTRLGLLDGGGWVVEVGAWDGVHLSNTFALLSKNFRALYIEGDPDKYQDLLATAAKLPEGTIVPVHARLDPMHDTLGDVIAAHGIADVAVLSIDIDSHDYDVWDRLATKPAIVIIEIDSSASPLDWKVYGTAGAGTTSFLPTLLLGERKGYTLVAHSGNMIFVRNDLWPRLDLPRTNPLGHFNRVWFDEAVENKRSSC